MYSLHGSELSQRIEHVGRRPEVHEHVPEQVSEPEAHEQVPEQEEPEAHEQVPEQVPEPEVYVYFVAEQVAEPAVHAQVLVRTMAEPEVEPEVHEHVPETEVSMVLRTLAMTDWSDTQYVNLFGYPNKAKKAPFGEFVWFGMRRLLDEAYQFPVTGSPGFYCTRQQLRIGWFWAPVPFSATRAWTTTTREDYDLKKRPRPVYPCYIHMYSETVVHIWCLHILAKRIRGWWAHVDRISFCDDSYNGW